MIMKGIFTYDRWGMLQRFVGKLVDTAVFEPVKRAAIEAYYQSKGCDANHMSKGLALSGATQGVGPEDWGAWVEVNNKKNAGGLVKGRKSSQNPRNIQVY